MTKTTISSIDIEFPLDGRHGLIVRGVKHETLSGQTGIGECRLKCLIASRKPGGSFAAGFCSGHFLTIPDNFSGGFTLFFGLVVLDLFR